MKTQCLFIFGSGVQCQVENVDTIHLKNIPDNYQTPNAFVSVARNTCEYLHYVIFNNCKRNSIYV